MPLREGSDASQDDAEHAAKDGVGQIVEGMVLEEPRGSLAPGVRMNESREERGVPQQLVVSPASATTKRGILPWLRIVAFLFCIGLFAHALGSSDIGAAWQRIQALGPLALIILIPFPFAIASDAWAWQRLLEGLGRHAPVRRLFRVRIATEAVTNSAPAGAVWAEALGPVLVAMGTGIPASDVFAATTAKRWQVVRMHGVYVVVAALLGHQAVLHASHNLLGNESLLLMVLAGAAVLLLISMGIEAVASRGQLGERLSGFLARVHLPRVKTWIESRHHHFAHADRQIGKLSSDRGAMMGSGARLALVWLFEGLETYLILRLLGANLSLIDVMSFDAGLSVLRSAAIFAPAGIGVQDVGYLTVLSAYDVPDANAIGPAFVVLKRMKEALYVLVGFVVLATLRREPGRRAATVG